MALYNPNPTMNYIFNNPSLAKQPATTYPATFVGPIKPQDKYANPINFTSNSTKPTPQVSSFSGGGSSGGSGGGSAPSYQAPQSAPSGYVSPEGQSFGSQEEYNRLIEDAYNPQIAALNEQAANLNLGQASALEQAQKAFDTQRGMAQGQLQTAQNQLGEVATKGQSAYESALAQARQVYDQLQRGYNQRFGGSSSAGAAATEIGNVERLKQQGSSYKQLQDVNRQVEMGRMDVQKQYDQNILQLEQNKQQAISAVQQDFRDKLAQINASKGMVESAKAQAKLQALQALRAQVLQVQQQETTFRQQLEMQKQQAAIQLDTYAKQLAMSQGGATNAANTGISSLNQKINPTATVSTGQSNMAYVPTGQIATQYKNPKDLYSQNIWSA